MQVRQNLTFTHPSRPATSPAKTDRAKSPPQSQKKTTQLPGFGQYSKPLLRPVRFGLRIPHPVTLNRLQQSPLAWNEELQKLDATRQALETAAKEMGLDPFPVAMHVMPHDKFLQLAARKGFPERYPHWSWGQEYYDLKLPTLYGIRNFNEVVVNNDPVQAYLPDAYPAYVHKILMIHALARSDFFKNSLHFRHTNRRMNEQIAGHADMIRALGNDPAIGKVAVEEFIDKVHSIRNLVDGTRPMRDGFRAEPITEENPERDVLGFLTQHSPELKPWQRDVVEMLRRESFAQVPHNKTQLLSDGWASFWNMKLNAQNPEMWDIENLTRESRFMATIFKNDPVKVNTYKLGFTIFKNLEKQFREQLKDHPDRDHEVLKALRKIRREEHDVSLIRKYLTQDMVEELLMYTYDPKKKAPNPNAHMHGVFVPPGDNQKPGTKLHISSRDFEDIRMKLIKMYENGGQPVIEIVSTNHDKQDGLLLRHLYEYDLKKDYAEKTLINLAQLWGNRVYLDTWLTDDQGEKTHVMLSSDGQQIVRRNLQ